MLSIVVKLSTQLCGPPVLRQMESVLVDDRRGAPEKALEYNSTLRRVWVVAVRIALSNRAVFLVY